MIESCPKKRMLLGIAILGALTILVLIIESNWTTHNNTRKNIYATEQNSSCWERETFTVVDECKPCTDFEIASKTIGVCVHTHYKEILKCANGETVSRSCDRLAHIEERAFWKFEGFMFLTTVLSTSCVYIRKKVLNKRVLQRVQRQLANSV